MPFKNKQESRLKQMEFPNFAYDNGSSYFDDPAFEGNKTLPIHRWVPWIAGFSASFVRGALDRYLDDKGTVLDPFCGVGTTLIEAALLGHDAIGFEINPYACFACDAKIGAYQIDHEEFSKEISRFQDFYREKLSCNYTPKSSAPEGFRTRSDFYSPKVLHKVLIFHDFVDTIDRSMLHDLFQLAFASTMVRYSNYSYEPSLGRRVSAGKQEITDFQVGEAIAEKLTQMMVDSAWFRDQMLPDPPDTKMVCRSFFEYEAHLPPQAADLIITSPPYLNNYHYYRNTRPQLYWLGYASSPQDLKFLKHSNFGKYWQTVRGEEDMALDFSLPASDIEERLESLRQIKPDKKPYGGRGWANYAVAYFNDCVRFARGIEYALKRGATALVVIGNSILQGVPIPTDRYFGEIAESIGLDLVGIGVPRSTRVGNSIIQSDVRGVEAKDSDQLYEAVVELRKG